MGGIHTVDVSLIIAPVIHEYIKSTADALGVEYEEGFDNKKIREQRSYARNATLAEKKMQKLGIEPAAPTMQAERPQVEEEPEMMTEEQPVGLMARRA
jgi:hypothetical protein